ncbi:MAG: hypothetical protein EOO41_01680, partial [Methanobacteriota archaeon]
MGSGAGGGRAAAAGQGAATAGLSFAQRGQTQKEQVATIDAFRRGQVNVLVATCIGEEGLDIGEVGIIVMFDAVKSPIRTIQRLGRTGRKTAGECKCLVTEQESAKFVESFRQYRKIALSLKRGTETNLFQLSLADPLMVSTNADSVIDSASIAHLRAPCYSGDLAALRAAGLRPLSNAQAPNFVECVISGKYVQLAPGILLPRCTKAVLTAHEAFRASQVAGLATAARSSVRGLDAAAGTAAALGSGGRRGRKSAGGAAAAAAAGCADGISAWLARNRGDDTASVPSGGAESDRDDDEAVVVSDSELGGVHLLRRRSVAGGRTGTRRRAEAAGAVVAYVPPDCIMDLEDDALGARGDDETLHAAGAGVRRMETRASHAAYSQPQATHATGAYHSSVAQTLFDTLGVLTPCSASTGTSLPPAHSQLNDEAAVVAGGGVDAAPSDVPLFGAHMSVFGDSADSRSSGKQEVDALLSRGGDDGVLGNLAHTVRALQREAASAHGGRAATLPASPARATPAYVSKWSAAAGGAGASLSSSAATPQAATTPASSVMSAAPGTRDEVRPSSPTHDATHTPHAVGDVDACTSGTALGAQRACEPKALVSTDAPHREVTVSTPSASPLPNLNDVMHLDEGDVRAQPAAGSEDEEDFVLALVNAALTGGEPLPPAHPALPDAAPPAEPNSVPCALVGGNHSGHDSCGGNGSALCNGDLVGSTSGDSSGERPPLAGREASESPPLP